MADDEGRTAPENDPEGSAARPPEGDQQGESGPEVDWKAEARKWEKLAKSNSEAAKRLTAIEDSQKTEQQKLVERAEQAERRAAEAETKVLRAEVASAKGLPGQLAQRLVGSTREELEADADALLEQVKTTTPTKTPPVDVVAGPNRVSNNGGSATDALARMLSG